MSHELIAITMFAVMLLMIAILIFFPEIALWLPRQLY